MSKPKKCYIPSIDKFAEITDEFTISGKKLVVVNRNRQYNADDVIVLDIDNPLQIIDAERARKIFEDAKDEQFQEELFRLEEKIVRRISDGGQNIEFECAHKYHVDFLMTTLEQLGYRNVRSKESKILFQI